MIAIKDESEAILKYDVEYMKENYLRLKYENIVCPKRLFPKAISISKTREVLKI